jgi:hypothetical protein
VSSEMSTLFQGMLAQSEANADAMGMGWLFRGSQALLSVLMLPGQLGLDFAGWLMDGGTATLSSWASAIWDYFHPLMEVLISVTLVLTNPLMAPLVFAGWAWRLLPDCLKPPIVDLLLDVVIDALASMPELPGLMQLSGVLLAGLQGALASFRSRTDEEKIEITNKVAQLLTGSPEFALGFVVGLFGGMLDGILDPLMLLWMVIEGMVWLVDNAGSLMASMSGVGEAAAGASTEASTSAEQAITLMPEAASTAAGVAAAGPMSNPDVVSTLAAAGERIKPPAEVIGETFLPAFEEAFSGEGKSSVADLAAMVGSLWETMVSLAEQAGMWLGQQLCESMLTSDVGYSLGYGVGYITGAILWEVLLGFLTGGMWEMLGPTSRAIVKFLDLGGELFGAAFHLLGELGSMLMKAIGPLLDWVGSTGLMRTLKDAFVTLSGELVTLSDELLSLLGSAPPGGLADEAAEGGLDTARRVVVVGEDAKLALAAQRIRPEAGVFDVVVHGDGSKLLVLEGGAWKELSPAELAEHLKAGGFEGGSVRLVSCGTGQADGAASKLAKELGVEVKAPTDTVWIHPDGTLTVGPTPDTSSGGWSRSTPDGAHEVVEDSARLGDEALERADEAVPVGGKELSDSDVQALFDDLVAKSPDAQRSFDGLVAAGLSKDRARRAVVYASNSGLLDELVVLSAKVKDPKGLYDALCKINAGDAGTKLAFEDAAVRARAGADVDVENGQADVIDHSTREAVQYKRVQGAGAGGFYNNLREAAKQVRGEKGEVPPAGFTKVVDVRIVNDKHAFWNFTQNQLQEKLDDTPELHGVDIIRITNGEGMFEFTPPFGTKAPVKTS